VRIQSLLVTGVLAAMLLHMLGAESFGAGAVGEPAPALVVETVSGQPFDLAQQRGKVVVVNFWATWCPPCRAEMPALDAVYRRYKDRGLVLVGLSADGRHEAKQVPEVMKAFAYPAAILREAKTNGFGSPKLLPETFVIDSQGIIRAVLTGADDKPLTEKQLEDAVVPLLPAEGH
jgi:cytochrome c biogenesis protein CcmG, thiol:disulfide interchange protein DsbE